MKVRRGSWRRLKGRVRELWAWMESASWATPEELQDAIGGVAKLVDEYRRQVRAFETRVGQWTVCERLADLERRMRDAEEARVRAELTQGVETDYRKLRQKVATLRGAVLRYQGGLVGNADGVVGQRVALAHVLEKMDELGLTEVDG